MWLLHSIYTPWQFQYNIVASSITRKFQSHLYTHNFHLVFDSEIKKKVGLKMGRKERNFRFVHTRDTLSFPPSHPPFPLYNRNFSYKNHVIAIKTTKMRMYEMVLCTVRRIRVYKVSILDFEFLFSFNSNIFFFCQNNDDATAEWWVIYWSNAPFKYRIFIEFSINLFTILKREIWNSSSVSVEFILYQDCVKSHRQFFMLNSMVYLTFLRMWHNVCQNFRQKFVRD